MECDQTENGGWCMPSPEPVRRGLKRKLGDTDSAETVQLVLGDGGAVRRRAGGGAPAAGLAHVDTARAPPSRFPPDLPFMSDMDEISYWVFTKRAPCLMTYDNMLKQQSSEADSPKPVEVASPKKKRRRKLSILNSSSEKQQNVYFEAPQQKQRTVLSSCKSGTLESLVDFNIKNSSIQEKRKRLKMQTNDQKVLHKKNKVVTSTPKVVTPLRRSVRRAQNILKNGQFNVAFEVYDSAIANGHGTTMNSKCNKTPTVTKSRKSLQKPVKSGQKIVPENNNAVTVKHETICNGRNGDSSDVSGFTANYIRSTKIQTKTPRNLRSKCSRNLMKEPQYDSKKDGTMLVCVNKSVNTADVQTAVLNCSTNSSQNVINVMTIQKNDKCNRGTSVLKFMDSKTPKMNDSACNKTGSTKQSRTAKLNISFQTDSSGASRYPKRHLSIVNSSNPDRKLNTNEKSYRTRSGMSTCLKQQPENSLIIFNNSTEPMSSDITLNVATAESRPKDNIKRKKHMSRVKYIDNSKKSADQNGQSLSRDSLRDKSGFAACFSDSDDDNAMLNQRKFFC